MGNMSSPLRMMALCCVSCSQVTSSGSQPDREAGNLPKGGDIAKIEKIISHDPCIGDLRSWQRLYAFAKKSSSSPARDIEFRYREAGKYGFTAGIKVAASPNWFNLDDRSYRLTAGRFDPVTGRLSVDYCGQNIPPSAQR